MGAGRVHCVIPVIACDLFLQWSVTVHSTLVLILLSMLKKKIKKKSVNGKYFNEKIIITIK